MSHDERFMAIALEEARAATAEGNYPFGAVIARVVIGATWADVPAHFHPEKGSLLGMARHLNYPFEHTAGVLRDECVELYGG